MSLCPQLPAHHNVLVVVATSYVLCDGDNHQHHCVQHSVRCVPTQMAAAQNGGQGVEEGDNVVADGGGAAAAGVLHVCGGHPAH